MKIIACIKHVPDTETRIKIAADGKSIVSEGVQYIISPYDEFAVEEALRLKEKFGPGEVTVISLGPERAKEGIRTALAMGADNAVHLNDAAFEGSDSYAIAKALGKAVSKLEYDLILCGKKAIDGDFEQVPQHLAEFLDLPHVIYIRAEEVSADKKTAVVRRQVEGGNTEVIECKLPAVLTCEKGLNEPRYPTLKGIMGAKKKPVTNPTPADLGLSANEVGSAGSKIELQKLSLPPQRTAGKKFEWDSDAVAEKVCKLLREEAKIL